MGAYRLCRIEKAANPFYLETIGVNAWSYEEICYYIVTYPSLIDETFMSYSLTRWLSTELGLAKLGRMLEKVIEARSGKADIPDSNAEGNDAAAEREVSQEMSGGSEAEIQPGGAGAFVIPILKEDGYLSQSELKTFEVQLARADEEGPEEGLKKKGDALVRCGRLAGAIEAYDEIIKAAGEAAGKDDRQEKRLKPGPGSKENSRPFLSSVWHNRGVAYMRLFEYPEALASFEKALNLTYTRDALKTYLYACAIARPRDRYEEELARLGVDEVTAAEVDRELQRTIDTIPPTPDMETDRYLEALTRRYHKAADV